MGRALKIDYEIEQATRFNRGDCDLDHAFFNRSANVKHPSLIAAT